MFKVIGKSECFVTDRYTYPTTIVALDSPESSVGTPNEFPELIYGTLGSVTMITDAATLKALPGVTVGETLQIDETFFELYIYFGNERRGVYARTKEEVVPLAKALAQHLTCDVMIDYATRTVCRISRHGEVVYVPPRLYQCGLDFTPEEKELCALSAH